MFARIAYRMTQPPRSPRVQVTVYYLALGLGLVALLRAWPGATAYLVLDDMAMLQGSGEGLLGAGLPRRSGESVTIALGASLLGALLLMIPISWTYMGTRIRAGVNQGVAQTLVVLPISVAAIVTIVQNSIALAFSLAGIVAAVRFRNALKDTSDALYIFTAIGVGLAAGVGALNIGLVLSVFFNFVVLSLWYCDYGTCPGAGPQPEYASGQLIARAEAAEKKKGKKKGTTTAPPG